MLFKDLFVLQCFRVLSSTHNDINVMNPEANRLVLSLVQMVLDMMRFSVCDFVKELH
jgi:hypothetical protein